VTAPTRHDQEAAADPEEARQRADREAGADQHRRVAAVEPHATVLGGTAALASGRAQVMMDLPRRVARDQSRRRTRHIAG
jgi:hypothetical protein